MAYLSYLGYLIYNIVKDKPNLKVDQIFLNEVDVPDIVICGASPELRILRCDLIANNGEKTLIDGCNSYVPPNLIDYDIYRDHCLTFKANKTIKFAKQNSGTDGLQKIGFYFYDNKTAAEMNTLGIASITIQLTPPGKSNTVLGAIAAAGGAFGTMAGIIVFFFGDFRLSPRGFVHKSLYFIQNSIDFIKRSRFYPKLNFKFSKINDEDKTKLVDGFRKMKYTIFSHLLQNDLDEINEDQGWIMKFEYKLENKFGRFANKIYQWLMNKAYIDTMFNKYKVRVESLNFSSTMHKDDQKLLNEEFRKIGHVIDTYVLVNRLKNQKDQKIFAEYKHKREIKFSDNMDEKDKKLLNDEFRKIRKLIDKHLLDEPNIEKIFEAYNSKREDFSNDMYKGDKELLIDEFRQIRNVICNRLLEKDVEIKYDNSVEKLKSLKIHINDRKLLVIEFYKIKHVINSILFNEPKNQEIYKEYKMNRKLKFSNEMKEKDKKLLKDEFRTIRYLVDNLLLNEQKVRKNINFSEKIDSCDKELLTYYISEVNGVRNEVRDIRNDIDNHVLKIV
ncbi:hypothetical protein RhiirA4_474892 [Rhizophagus irregularis]|uniref:Uncharacterized protein n=1 Tax=Rhizophagus irregularis TaxID=588596 RepID=A0A2I1H979_9GLOM|nr:hypothetical protein RhiirA4_474892 [Rhizophagus irregularis]